MKNTVSISSSSDSNTLESNFSTLTIEKKLLALKRLSKGKKLTYNCKIAAPKTLEQKYDAIIQCISYCTERELQIIRLELQKNAITYQQTNNFFAVFFPFAASVISLLTSSIFSATEDQDTKLFTIAIIFFWSLSYILLFYLGKRMIDNGIKTSAHLLKLIEFSKHPTDSNPCHGKLKFKIIDKTIVSSQINSQPRMS